MGGISLRSSRPRTPAIVPQIVSEEEDPVPLYFLDDTGAYSAGIEPSIPLTEENTMGNSFSTFPTKAPAITKRVMKLTSAMRKSTPSNDRGEGNKLKKLVRFLDRVEVVPAPASFYSISDQRALLSNKKQKLSNEKPSRTSSEFYEIIEEDHEVDEGIASGLGRAGSPHRSPNRSPSRSPDRSPNCSKKDLSRSNVDGAGHLSLMPRIEIWSPPSPPPSWRIPPESLVGRQPRVIPPPRVRSPSNADEEVDLMVDDDGASRDSGCYADYRSDDEAVEEEHVRPGVSYVRANSPPKLQQFHPPAIYPVIARKMWPHGEIRFEDQWGRRLIPIGHKDSFRFDLWPVEEDVALEGESGPVRGAWVKGRATRGDYWKPAQN